MGAWNWMGFYCSLTWLHPNICCDLYNSWKRQYHYQSKSLCFSSFSPLDVELSPILFNHKLSLNQLNSNKFLIYIHYRKYRAQFNQIYMNVNFVVNIIVIMMRRTCIAFKRCFQCINHNQQLFCKHHRPIIKQLINIHTMSTQYHN